MKYEPPIDKPALIATLRAEYALAVERLTFVPHGAASAYVLHCTHGARYFLKLWRSDTTQGRRGMALLATYMPLSCQLYEEGILRDLPYPLPTQAGDLWTSFLGHTIAVFNFIPGQPLPFNTDIWPDTIRDQLARDLAALHSASVTFQGITPPREVFALPFENDLLAALDTLEQTTGQSKPGSQALRALLLPRRDEIIAQLDRVHAFQQVVRTLDSPFALCHTDIHGANLLVDDAGRLTILDWEDVKLAPPEHDLQAVADSHFARFLRVYREAGGMEQIHIEHFAFYLARRYLEDLSAFALSILYDTTVESQNERALSLIRTECIAKWATLDEMLAQIAQALRDADVIPRDVGRSRH